MTHKSQQQCRQNSCPVFSLLTHTHPHTHTSIHVCVGLTDNCSLQFAAGSAAKLSAAAARQTKGGDEAAKKRSKSNEGSANN